MTTHSSIRIVDVAIEAAHNLTPWSSRGFVAIVVAVLVGAVSGGVLSSATHAHLSEVAREDLSGAQVVVIGDSSAPGGPTISRTSCESLASDPFVRAAGTYRISQYRTFTQVGSVAVIEASPQLLDFQGRTVLMGDELARSAQLATTGVLTETDSPDQTHDYKVGPTMPTGIDVNGSLSVARVPDAMVRSCVVWLRSSVQAERALPVVVARLDMIGSGPLPVRASPESAQAQVRFARSTDGWTAVAWGALAGAAAGLFRRFRPSEAISYRLSGFTRAHLAQLVIMEDATCAAVLVLAGLAILTADPAPVLALSNALWLAAAGSAFLTTSLLLALLVILPNPVRLAKH